MTTSNIKISLPDDKDRQVVFSNFKLYQINYTFDIYINGSVNEFCCRKDEIVSLIKSLEDFEELSKISIQDYDSPSYIIFEKLDHKVSVRGNLTFPENSKFSLVLEYQDIKKLIAELIELIYLIDDKEYESKMSKEYGLVLDYIKNK